MTGITCADITAWLAQQRADYSENRPSDELIDHISNCPRCRGLLLVLVADLTGVHKDVIDVSCAEVEEDLAAFIDYERHYGLAQAMRMFPHLWWHTLVCPSCDELYRLVRDLVEEANVVLEPAEPVVIRRVRLLPALFAVLKVPLTTLNQMLSLNQRLGTAFAANQADIVVAEQQNEAGLIQLLVRRARDGAVALVAQTQPPSPGVALLTVARAQFRAPLDERGCAVFAEFGAVDLDGAAESDVVLTIAQE